MSERVPAHTPNAHANAQPCARARAHVHARACPRENAHGICPQQLPQESWSEAAFHEERTTDEQAMPSARPLSDEQPMPSAAAEGGTASISYDTLVMAH